MTKSINSSRWLGVGDGNRAGERESLIYAIAIIMTALMMIFCQQLSTMFHLLTLHPHHNLLVYTPTRNNCYIIVTWMLLKSKQIIITHFGIECWMQMRWNALCKSWLETCNQMCVIKHWFYKAFRACKLTVDVWERRPAHSELFTIRLGL